MDYIELKWGQKTGATIISSDDIDQIIEIDDQNKEIKNIKSFFREIVFKSFLNDWTKDIKLISSDTLEIKEVNIIIEDLITICNDELRSKLLKK